MTTAFTVGDAYGFVITSRNADGSVADINLIMAKQGSTMRGMAETLSLAISTGLAHGVPLETFVRQFTDVRFEPAGMTDDPEIPWATSIIDYMVRRVALDVLPLECRVALGVLTPRERDEAEATPAALDPAEMFVSFELPVQVSG